VRKIHRRAANGHRIGIATIYRTLNMLVEAGMVKRQVFPEAIVEIDDAELQPLLEEEARRLGYRLVEYSLTLFARPDR
jgi:Fur family transcriptional regulator, ferric uptake regulator